MPQASHWTFVLNDRMTTHTKLLTHPPARPKKMALRATAVALVSAVCVAQVSYTVSSTTYDEPGCAGNVTGTFFIDSGSCFDGTVYSCHSPVIYTQTYNNTECDGSPENSLAAPTYTSGLCYADGAGGSVMAFCESIPTSGVVAGGVGGAVAAIAAFAVGAAVAAFRL